MRVGLVVVFAAGCRLNFNDSVDARQQADVAIDAVDPCSLSTTIGCDHFASAPPPAQMTGDALWIASGGRSGGAVQAHGAGLAITGGIHFPIAPLTSGMLYARVYANVAPAVTIQSFAVLLELNNSQATGGQEKISGDIVTNDDFGIGAPYSGGGPISTVVVERGRWFCMELGVEIDATAGSMSLSIDGAEVARSTMRNTLIPMGFQEVLLSSTVSNADPDFTVTFDDLVISTVPIGC